MSFVVRGEASESDDESGDNINKTNLNGLKILSKDVESDEEVYIKGFSDGVFLKKNLLQRRLIESNIAICNSLKGLIRTYAFSISKELLKADQVLLKSQVLIQSVIASLKVVETNVKHLKERTEDVFTANFIPSINSKY